MNIKTAGQLKCYAKCKECKKTFYKTYEWIYKRELNGRWLWYCSWTCYRKKAKMFDKKLRGE